MNQIDRQYLWKIIKKWSVAVRLKDMEGDKISKNGFVDKVLKNFNLQPSLSSIYTFAIQCRVATESVWNSHFHKLWNIAAMCLHHFLPMSELESDDIELFLAQQNARFTSWYSLIVNGLDGAKITKITR